MCIVLFSNSYAQEAETSELFGGRFVGNFQLEAQNYEQDSLIDAPKVSEKILSNAFFNLMYSTNNLEIGARYESYFGPMQGFDPAFAGNGLSYRYARYKTDVIDITVGDFYEQFGSGLIFRAYEERALGNDNAIDGARIILNPYKGIKIIGLIGKQRYFWEKTETLVRGTDINFNINDLFEIESDYLINFGTSLISRFQKDNDPVYKLPENVMAYAFRGNVSSSLFNIESEYAFKINDPNIINKNSYNPGKAFLLNGSFFGFKGFSIGLNYHWLDNMDFRMDRNSSGLKPMLNYIPPISKQQAYRLATAYPFATQINGEAGIQFDVAYKFAKKSLFGGKYGTNVALNFSQIHNIDSNKIDKFEYESNFLNSGERLLFREINLNVDKKISDNDKFNFTYINQLYDKDYCENIGQHYGKINANIFILDYTRNFSDDLALRGEFQYMAATQDSVLNKVNGPDPDNINGDWIMGMLEFTIVPNFFFAISDEINIGNEWKEKAEINYYSIAAGWIHESTRVQLSYGLQRKGILCVGGVCRTVPASKGLYLSISTSF